MFQLLFERSGDAIILYDPQANAFVDCNDAAAALMRAGSKEHLLLASPADLAPTCQPDGRESREAAAQITALVRQKGSHRFEWTARRLDGSNVPLEILATAIPANGRELHVVVPRDITERKRAEAESRELHATLERRIAEHTARLSASEARLRTLVEHAPEAIVVFDGQTGRFLSGNPNACRMYGRSADELTRLSPAEVSPEFQADGRRSAVVAREKMDEALAGEAPVFDWIHRHSSGRLIPTEVRLVRLPSEGGEPLLRASIIDNTERKRREAIQQATFEISEAVHTADDLPSFYRRVHSIIETLMPAKNFYIALYESATETISFPYFVDETEPAPRPFRLGTGLTSYVLRKGRPLLVGREMNARKRRVGNEVTFEDHPELRYVEIGTPAAIWVGVPLSAAGRPFGVMALQDYHDDHAYGEEEKEILTFVAKQTALAIERKRAELEVWRALERERELSQLKTNFVSMVSHEFRTPLGIILSSAQILSDYFDQLSKEERVEHLGSIAKNSQLMAGLMEEVLVLSRVESGKLAFEPGALDLASFCGRLVQEVQSATGGACRVELAVTHDCAGARGDERLLRHIFTNILANAVKYSSPGSLVEFTVEREQQYAACRVRDRGIGIPEDDLERLFTAFHRGRNVGLVSGSGLGLVIVKRCVELHRGSIRVESKMGEGTTITVRLPLFDHELEKGSPSTDGHQSASRASSSP